MAHTQTDKSTPSPWRREVTGAAGLSLQIALEMLMGGHDLARFECYVLFATVAGGLL